MENRQYRLDLNRTVLRVLVSFFRFVKVSALYVTLDRASNNLSVTVTCEIILYAQ